jgi:hypothetical protein
MAPPIPGLQFMSSDDPNERGTGRGVNPAATLQTGVGSSVWVRTLSGDVCCLSGNVGIGTSQPRERLEVRGNVYSTGNYMTASDHAVKRAVRTVDARAMAAAVAGLRVCNFTKFGTPTMGFIAQEVREQLPIAVVQEGDILALNSDCVLAALVAAHQDLVRRHERLTAAVAATGVLAAAAIAVGALLWRRAM